MKLLVGIQNQLTKSFTVPPCTAVPYHFGRSTADSFLEKLLQTFFLNEGSKGFVETGVVFHIDHLMGHLMDQGRGKVGVFSFDEGAQHRVGKIIRNPGLVEPTECGVGRYRAHRNIQIFVHPLGIAQCFFGVEISPVFLAADEPVTPLISLQFQLWSGSDNLGDVGSAEVYISGITGLFRKRQSGNRKFADFQYEFQFSGKFRIGPRILNQFLNVLFAGEQVQMPACSLPVKTKVGTASQQQQNTADCQYFRKPQP